MARIYGLNGVLRGRQGNNVFSVQNGTQVVKAYQPVVSNPRSTEQLMQRAKFALAGKMSSIVPSGALVGLGATNKRSRRSAFVAEVARRASVNAVLSPDGGQFVASVAYADISFSHGSLARHTLLTQPTAAYTGTAGEYRVHVVLKGFNTNPIPTDAPAGYGEIVIVCMFDPTGSRLDGCQYYVRGNSDTSLDFAVNERTGCRVCAYVVPFAPLDGVAGYRSSGNLYDSANDVSLAMNSDSFLSGMRFGDSRLVWVISVAAPTQSVAPSTSETKKKE